MTCPHCGVEMQPIVTHAGEDHWEETCPNCGEIITED